MNLRPGEVFVFGLTSETAQALIAVCNDLGIDRQVIRTNDSGFVVPENVGAEYERRQVPQWASEGAVF